MTRRPSYARNAASRLSGSVQVASTITAAGCATRTPASTSAARKCFCPSSTPRAWACAGTPGGWRLDRRMIHLLREKATPEQVGEMLAEYTAMIKLAVDIRRRLLAAGGLFP